MPRSLRKKSELSSHQISIHKICGAPDSLRTSSKQEGNFNLRVVLRCMLVPVSQLRYVTRGTPDPTPFVLAGGFTLRVFARESWVAGGLQRAVNILSKPLYLVSEGCGPCLAR